jgi:prophage DNA circulation protein
LIDRHSLSGGRRIALHEYPLRSTPFAEDLGRAAREFSVELFVLGQNYMPDRDRLIAALEEPGPGQLAHPYLGRMRAVVKDFRLTESTARGGIARFSVTFVEAGEQREPQGELQTPAAVADAADAAQEEAAASFAAAFSVDGQPAFVRADAKNALTRATGVLEDAIGAVPSIPEAVTEFRDQLSHFSNALSELVLAPKKLANEVTRLVDDLQGIAQRPGEALSMYDDAETFGADDKPITGATPARDQQRANRAAINALVRDTSAAAAARTTSRTTWSALEDAVATRDRISERLDDRAEVSGDARFERFTDLRLAVIRDIRTRAADLARVGYYAPPQVQPALVLAHRIHGDASRDQEIIDRNRVRHPGFVPGGDRLEVLLDP